MDSEKIVLDSWSVLAFLGGELKSREVMELMIRATEGGGALLMSIVNVGEIWCTIARRVSSGAADEDVESLRKLGIRFIDADWDLTRAAADFKSRHRISYADAYAAALAKKHNATLVTGDPDFKPLAKEVRLMFLSSQ
jgi:predicted nucleic acid-binding protein